MKVETIKLEIFLVKRILSLFSKFHVVIVSMIDKRLDNTATLFSLNSDLIRSNT